MTQIGIHLALNYSRSIEQQTIIMQGKKLLTIFKPCFFMTRSKKMSSCVLHLLLSIHLLSISAFVLYNRNQPTLSKRRIWNRNSSMDMRSSHTTDDDFLPDRRQATQMTMTLLSTLLMNSIQSDAIVGSTEVESVNTMSRLDLPPITHKVFMDVRIARADGTFYVRDDPPGTIPTPDNQVFYARLILGLFGTVAPSHVEKFLKYVLVSPTTSTGEYDDSPLPSYSRSVFKSLDQRTGLLTGGAIPGLDKTTFGGSPALQYGSRIIPAQLWIEKSATTAAAATGSGGKGGNANYGRIYHTQGNLLTHRNLDVSPEFGITTRAAPELDSTHTVFGCLLSDASSKAFIERIIDLPTYSMDRPTIDIDNDSGASVVIVDAASSLYTLQRDFFRQAAKTFGDTRLDKTFEGKLLRRVEVTQVGILNL